MQKNKSETELKIHQIYFILYLIPIKKTDQIFNFYVMNFHLTWDFHKMKKLNFPMHYNVHI